MFFNILLRREKLDSKIKLSRSRYHLNLASWPDGSADYFIKYFLEGKGILNAIKRIQMERCNVVQKYYRINKCSPCEIPEINTLKQLKKANKIIKNDCPNVEIFENFENEYTCFKCVIEKVGNSKPYSCQNIWAYMSLAHGTFDVALLSRVPDQSWGLHLLMELQKENQEMFSDILTIPCHRIRWPWEIEEWESDWKFTNPIICFTFISLFDQNEKTNYISMNEKKILAIRDRIMEIKTNGKEVNVPRKIKIGSIKKLTGNKPDDTNRLELFLTYGHFPLMLKSEFFEESEVHNFLKVLKEIPEISYTSTIFSSNMKHLTHFSNTKYNKISQSHTYFLLVIKINKKLLDPKNYENDTLNIIIKEILYFNKSYKRDIQIGKWDNGKNVDDIRKSIKMSCVRGYYDCIVPVRAESAIDIQFLVTDCLRSREEFLRIITIPIWVHRGDSN